MKKLILYMIIGIQPYFLTAQPKDSDIINFEASYTSDFGRNFSGGIKQGNFYMGMMNISLDIKPCTNTEFYMQVQNTHGATPSANNTGDLEVFSNIENGDYTYLYMAWVKHNFGRVSATLGVHDLNSEFYVTNLGGTFLNSSFGILPSVSMNMPVPIFPKNALGMVLSYELSKNINILTSLYDGDPGTLDSDPYNIDLSVDFKKQGFFSASEIHYTPSNFGFDKSTYKIGVQYHSGDFLNFSDSSLTKGNFGLYAIADHYVTENLGVFSQIGLSNSKTNFNPFYISLGFNLEGIGKKKNDILGITATYTAIPDDYHKIDPLIDKNFESAIELTYKFQINKNITIQPDIQYIINPGASKYLDNVWVGLIRININNLNANYEQFKN